MDASLQTTAPDRKALIFIVVTVILNTLGVTLLAPVAPFLVARYVTDPATIGVAVGWLTSIYAVCQFIAAPGLGALSDRFGRRPLLLICLLGTAVGYLFLGIGGALWVLLLGRAIDGLTGANTSIIIAYITDIVPAEDRGRYFGMIGAIGAVSIVLGPTVGGLMAKLGYEVPFFIAGGIAFANVLFGLLFMPESLRPERRMPSFDLAKLNPFTTLRDVAALPQLRWLFAALFCYTLSIIIVPATLGLFTHDRLNWDTDSIGVLFSVFGVVTILVQGVLLQWLLKRASAAQITVAGMCFSAAAFVLMALVGAFPEPALLYGSMMLFGIGDGLTSPALLDLITRATDEGSQGKVQGGSQSVQSLANIVGPVFAGNLYDRVTHTAAYVGGGGFVVLALGAVGLALPALRRLGSRGKAD